MTHFNALKKLLWLALALVAATGCGGKKDPEPAATVGAGADAAPSWIAGLDNGPRAADTEPADEALAGQGAGLFTAKGCSACHAFGKRVTGPDLQGVTHRRTEAWIQGQILHPAEMVKHDPTSHALFATYALQIPNQGLSPAEARAVLNYFKKQDHELDEHK